MKRYLVFAGYGYYPAGGWDDFREAYDTLTAALQGEERLKQPISLFKSRYDWAHVVDLETMKKVSE